MSTNQANQNTNSLTLALPLGMSIGKTGLVTTGNLNLLTYDDFQATLSTIGLLTNAYKWSYYDLLLIAQEKLGQEFWQLVADLGVNKRTIDNGVSLVRTFPLNRRRAALTMKHHDHVRGLDLQAQERFLDHAESSGLNADELYQLVQEYKKGAATPPISRFYKVPEDFLRAVKEVVDGLVDVEWPEEELNPMTNIESAIADVYDGLREINWT